MPPLDMIFWTGGTARIVRSGVSRRGWKDVAEAAVGGRSELGRAPPVAGTQPAEEAPVEVAPVELAAEEPAGEPAAEATEPASDATPAKPSAPAETP